MKVSPEAAKRMGIEVGKVMHDPRNSAFMSEEQIKLVGAPSLKQMALKILAEERAKLSGKEVWKHLDSKVPCALKEKNPPKVEDKTEAEKGVTKAKAGDDKIAAPIGGKKVTTKSPKYTPLSGLVPAKIKRADKDEVPTITDNTEEEEAEEESIEDLTKPEHIVKLKEAIFGKQREDVDYGDDPSGDWEDARRIKADLDAERNVGQSWDTEDEAVTRGERNFNALHGYGISGDEDAGIEQALDRADLERERQEQLAHTMDVERVRARAADMEDRGDEAVHIPFTQSGKIWRQGQNTGGKLDDPAVVAAHGDANRANNAKISRIRGDGPRRRPMRQAGPQPVGKVDTDITPAAERTGKIASYPSHQHRISRDQDALKQASQVHKFKNIPTKEFFKPSGNITGTLDGGSGDDSKGVMGARSDGSSNIKEPETKAEGIRRMANMLEAYSRKSPLV